MLYIYTVHFSNELIILFQIMHYTILVFSCPYICFDTPCAILRGVVESSQFSMHPSPCMKNQRAAVW
jgi:hypothetical protein